LIRVRPDCATRVTFGPVSFGGPLRRRIQEERFDGASRSCNRRRSSPPHNPARQRAALYPARGSGSKSLSRFNTVKHGIARGSTDRLLPDVEPYPPCRRPTEGRVLARGLNRLRKNSRPGRKDVPQGLNHEWPPHGQLFGIAYATFFTESRRHLARRAQLNRPFVAARRILNYLRHSRKPHLNPLESLWENPSGFHHLG